MTPPQKIDWPYVAHEALGTVRPVVLLLALSLALFLLSKASGEKLSDLVRLLFRELRSLIRGERNVKSLNALVLLGAAFLIVVIFASPLSEIMPELSNDSSWLSAMHEGIAAFLILAFLAAGVLSVWLTRDEP